MSTLRQLCPTACAAALLLVLSAACSDPSTDALGPGDLADAAFAKGGPHQLPTSGGRIFFSSYISGNGDIFSVNADGTDLRRLTFTTEEERNPAVSPDGKKVAFLRRNGTQYDIWIMNSDGSKPKLRLPQPDNIENMYGPVWSPDGRTITFSYQEQGVTFRMASISVNNGAPVIYPFQGKYPSWSPDGQFLAYSSFIVGEGDALFSVRPDGTGGSIHTVFQAGCCGVPQWSPDGSRILYHETVLGVRRFRFAGVTTTGSILEPAEEPATMGAWSPDATRIAYGDVYGDLRIVLANGGASTLILAGYDAFGTLSWSR